MSFLECLAYAVLIFMILIVSLIYIWEVLDIYYTHKEKHIYKMLGELAKAIKKVSEENKDGKC